MRNKFAVSGMNCAACAARVEKVLRNCEGVNKASVNFAAATAHVDYNPERCTPEQLQRAVRDAGYDLELNRTADALEQEQQARYRDLCRRTAWAVALSLPVVIIGMFFMHMPYANLIMLVLSTPVTFWFGRQFFVGAWKQLRHGFANMDTLVALSTGIAWLFSVANMVAPQWWEARGIHPHVYFEAGAVIIAFILLGRTLESRAKRNTSEAIRKLMGLQPKRVVRIEADGTAREIALEEIVAGDLLLVRPGERIAVDGAVVAGDSYVDESMLSGEPVPVRKSAGAKVYAGTINGTGSFRYRAERVGADTLLAKIIRMVETAQGSKAPVQRLVDKIAAVFVPVIICIALISFVVWLLCDGADGFSHGLLAAVTVLIIACPCALGLATPTAIMVGIGKGAELGILIKDAETLEVAPHINAMVLDKTGTLTEGRPKVQALHRAPGVPDADAVLVAIERASEHPLAQAVVENLESVAPAEIEDFRSIPGRGVSARRGNALYLAGNRKLMEERGVDLPQDMLALEEQLAAEANSIVWFAGEGKILALIGIADPLKATSAAAVAQLRDMGIDVYMLTGDNGATARAVAVKAGIAHVEAEVLPQDKAAFVEQLQRQGKRVAMVGDGINDSAALAVADLSIAMGTGSDIAIEVAGMTIISADLGKLPVGIRLAKATVRTIRRNLFWAFIYNMIGVPIAAGVLYPLCGFLLNPMIAGAAMAFSSVSVVANSLLLRRKRFGESAEASETLAPAHEVASGVVPVDESEVTLAVEGMMCAHCARAVDDALRAVAGVADVDVDLAAGTARVRGTADVDALISAVVNAGYEAHLQSDYSAGSSAGVPAHEP